MTKHPPPPPPPPDANKHQQHHYVVVDNNNNGGNSNYNPYFDSNNNAYNVNNNNISNGGSNSGSNSGNSSNFPFKTADMNITYQSGFMFLVIAAFFLQLFGFFKQNCSLIANGKKKEGYLDVGDFKKSSFLPYTDNPTTTGLRNRKVVTMPANSSPSHPAINKTPSKTINTQTLQHLYENGIRMTAHGVHCEPRKVWLSIDDESVIWQSEFQKNLTDSSGQLSTVPVRGSVHRIDWSFIEYIDVGRRTDALKQAPETVQDHVCFSLLTPDGSLDLQTNSQLERDTIVSCIGMKLDEVNQSEWRQMYSSSNPTSFASGAFSDFYSQASNENNFSSSIAGNPYRDLTVDV